AVVGCADESRTRSPPAPNFAAAGNYADGLRKRGARRRTRAEEFGVSGGGGAQARAEKPWRCGNRAEKEDSRGRGAGRGLERCRSRDVRLPATRKKATGHRANAGNRRFAWGGRAVFSFRRARAGREPRR